MLRITESRIERGRSIGAVRTVYEQRASRPRPQPIPAFEGQDVSWANAYLGGDSTTPNALQLVTIEDASFVVCDGYDGIVLTRNGTCLAETLYFTMEFDSYPVGDRLARELQIPAEPAEREFEEVFLGFDAAWMNYYHWLCHGVAKSWMAGRFLPASCPIVVPDHEARERDHASGWWKPLAYSREVWRQSLELAGLSDRVVALPAGVYKARRIHLLELESDTVSHVLDMGLLGGMFAEIRAKLSGRQGPGVSLFVSRRQTDNRINSRQLRALETALQRRGFAIVTLESLSLLEQAKLFYNADIVVAAHGAGLVNILFGSDRLRVLELNRPLHGEKEMRPWFYLLAAQRNLRYACLDGGRGGFPPRRVLEAVDRLLGAP